MLSIKYPVWQVQFTLQRKGIVLLFFFMYVGKICREIPDNIYSTFFTTPQRDFSVATSKFKGKKKVLNHNNILIVHLKWDIRVTYKDWRLWSPVKTSLFRSFRKLLFILLFKYLKNKKQKTNQKRMRDFNVYETNYLATGRIFSKDHHIVQYDLYKISKRRRKGTVWTEGEIYVTNVYLQCFEKGQILKWFRLQLKNLVVAQITEKI